VVEEGLRGGDMVVLLTATEGVPAGTWGIVRGLYERVDRRRVIVHFPALGAVLALTLDAVEKLV
jgi:hypothetical protein